MKIQIIRIILIILLLCTFYIIFGFSSQDGETSGTLSRRVTESILKTSNEYNALEDEQKNEILEKTEKVIRKLAHFSIYTVVGLLLMGLLATYKMKDKWRILLSLVIGIIYASTDEFHQSFSPGRTPSIKDVGIDTLGVIVGILLLILIRAIYKKIMVNCNKKSVR